MITNIIVFEVFSVVSIVLSIWNTIVLYRHRMVTSKDVGDLVKIIQGVMSVLGVNDDEVMKEIEKLLEKNK